MALRQHTEETENSDKSSGQEVELIEAALRFGQRRDLILGPAFANPAWDIMLRLYAATRKDRDLTLDAVTAAAQRSRTTERWLDALVQDDLIQIASKNGVSVVQLTTHGKASMDALFASALAGTPLT